MAADFEARVFQLTAAGDVDQLKVLLEATKASAKDPLNLNFRDKSRRTPLHLAAESKNLSITKLLLSAGCRPKGLDSEGYTPLHIAVWKKAFDIVEALSEAGADPNFCSENSVYTGYTALHIACHHHDESIVRILLDHKAKVTLTTDSGQTPLHIVCDHGFSSAIPRMLLRIDDSKLNTGDKNGFTALILACSKDKLEIIDYLLSLPSIDLFGFDKSGETALHHALKVPLQRLFGGGFAVLPVAQSAAYAIVRAAASHSSAKRLTEVKNALGGSPLEFESESFAKLLQLVESDLRIRNNFPSLDNLLSSSAVDLKRIGAPAVIAESAAELIAAIRKEQEETVLREQDKGGCPFIEAKQRSKGPPSTTTPAAAGAPPSVPAHATAGGDISQCPFLNPALKKQQPQANSAARSVDLENPVPNSSSGGKCPIPFHQQLVQPSFWISAGCLVAAVYIASRVWRSSQKI